MMNISDKVFGSLYFIPFIIGSVCLFALTYGIISNNQVLIMNGGLGLLLSPVLVILKNKNSHSLEENQ